MFNKEMIQKYANQYKEMYKKQYGENPTSWFSYLRWLGSFTSAGNFDDTDKLLAIEALQQ